METMFNCARCGKLIEQGKFKNRKYCPECAKIMKKERGKIASVKRNKEIVESNEIKKKGTFEKSKNIISEANKKADAELDKRSQEQIQSQCRFCKYQLKSASNNKIYTIGCDYISWKGHSTDKGNGPGDCRSFEPLTKKTKAERIARRKRAISISEADKAQNTGEKMREVNQL